VTTVIAAIDASPAARPVIEAAAGIAALLHADVEAVHVEEGPHETPEAVARRGAVAFRTLPGPVEPTLLAAVSEPGVVAAVLGARSSPGGRRPVGSTALHVLQRTATPIVVVPPDSVSATPRRFRRLLIPLEGSDAASQAVLDGLCPFLGDDVDLVVLHVFTPATAPRIMDRPGRDLAVLADEFLRRHCPTATGLEWRAGSVPDAVMAVAPEVDADLVVLSWAQDISPTRAAVVREVLGRSKIPVLLLPLRPTTTG
jgi:nucleotide-binding universal stress UspA family protein